ncbi:hypothetical protein PT160_08640 [Erysipelothrix rhusiopathiae]|nr:hypothetical protein [Erysipelothrix rhusiopathiae]MDE8338289.1 hypothetical protein [Erysipelothrix rhusiopathiae]
MKLYFNDGNIVNISEISHAIVNGKKNEDFYTFTFENLDSNEKFVKNVKKFIKYGETINVYHKADENSELGYHIDQLVGFTV